jgi:hypothetical protein
MDPTRCLLELIELHQRIASAVTLAQENELREQLVNKFGELVEWTSEGGYEPTWPQRRLTHEEEIQLLDRGDAL